MFIMINFLNNSRADLFLKYCLTSVALSYLCNVDGFKGDKFSRFQVESAKEAKYIILVCKVNWY